jgi:hypothetical protein
VADPRRIRVIYVIQLGPIAGVNNQRSNPDLFRSEEAHINRKEFNPVDQLLVSRKEDEVLPETNLDVE